MLKWFCGKENNKGAIMMEAIIVYLITMCLLFFVLAVFSVLFQRWNLQTIANETVTRMAQTYRLNDADNSSGLVTEEQMVAVGRYRYFVSQKMEDKIRERISTYAQWRITNTTYTKNVREPDIDAVVIADGLGRRHIELTISGEYSVPFGEILDYFGFPGTTTYEVNAYADTVDLIDYINFVDYVDTWTSLNQFKSSTIGLINSVLGLIDNIREK